MSCESSHLVLMVFKIRIVKQKFDVHQLNLAQDIKN